MRKKIIILGGGFGGLKAVNTLAKKIKKLDLNNEYEVILIDKKPYHTYTPLLYEVATTSKETADYTELKSLVAYPFEQLFKNEEVKFIQGKVFDISLTQKIISLEKEILKFDYLIIALGSETNYFNIKGLKENSFCLKSFNDAIAIRDAIVSKIEINQKKIKILIGGGGSTGVELASEIKEWLYEIEKKEKNGFLSEVIIIEGHQSVLYGLDKKVIKKVSQRLNKLGIKIKTGHFIKELGNKKAILDNGEEISFDIFVWAGGIKAPLITEKIPCQKEEKGGRIKTTKEMECILKNNNLSLKGKIYAIGDTVCFYDSSGNPIPAVARAAITQGKIAAQNIVEEIKNEKGIKSIKKHYFKPKNYPYIIPVGGKYAVAKIGPIIIAGFWGWLFKGLVEIYYLISIMPFSRALTIWLKGLKVFIQNDRLG